MALKANVKSVKYNPLECSEFYTVTFSQLHSVPVWKKTEHKTGRIWKFCIFSQSILVCAQSRKYRHQ